MCVPIWMRRTIQEYATGFPLELPKGSPKLTQGGVYGSSHLLEPFLPQSEQMVFHSWSQMAVSESLSACQ